MVLLEVALTDYGITLAQARAPGMIIVVQTPNAEWTMPLRKGWEQLFSADTGDEDFPADGYSRGWIATGLIVREGPPDNRELKNDNDELATAIWTGRAVVGFGPDPAWLPRDLVVAADYQIAPGLLTPGVLGQLAYRQTGTKPTAEFTVAEAAAVTPRLLRLGVRPGQTADGFLSRVRDLLAADLRLQQATVAPTKRPTTPRDAPTLERLQGLDEAVAWGLTLKEDLEFYKLGLRVWADVDKGLVLSGPPGTGKTMFARALAASCDVPLFTGSYAAWLGTGSGHQGDFMRAMRKSFADAKAQAPCIMFIDEIDAFGDRARVSEYHRDWMVQIINGLLAELDGVSDREGVVVVGACNDANRLDPALVRSGRLDRHMYVGTPNSRALVMIMREHLGSLLAQENLHEASVLAMGLPVQT
jgi:hypothetical protein